jgi:hypothetical protein
MIFMGLHVSFFEDFHEFGVGGGVVEIEDFLQQKTYVFTINPWTNGSTYFFPCALLFFKALVALHDPSCNAPADCFLVHAM